MRQHALRELGRDRARDGRDRVVLVVEVLEALDRRGPLNLSRERDPAARVGRGEIHVQRAFGRDREARGDQVDLPTLERRNQPRGRVAQDLDLEPHVGREPLRDVDLEADQIPVRRARGPWSIERDADAQRAALLHLQQRARRRVLGRRRGQQHRDG